MIKKIEELRIDDNLKIKIDSYVQEYIGRYYKSIQKRIDDSYLHSLYSVKFNDVEYGLSSNLYLRCSCKFYYEIDYTCEKAICTFELINGSVQILHSFDDTIYSTKKERLLKIIKLGLV